MRRTLLPDTAKLMRNLNSSQRQCMTKLTKYGERDMTNRKPRPIKTPQKEAA